MKKIIIYLMIVLMPFNALAYSDQVILGGQTLGIDIKSDGVLIVGFYKVDGKYNKGTKELQLGDYILKVNNVEVNTILDLSEEVDNNKKDEEIDITFRRLNKEYTTTLKLIESNNVYKTGLYVKDSITGIGTLTYIDPNTNIYGALGHEIIDSNTNLLIEINDGSIFRNEISSIDKSTTGSPGSKNAKFDYQTKYGSIFENTKYGIYGLYNNELKEETLVEVAKPSEIKIGPATIYTVLDGETIEEFTINITNINETSDIKNITFEITDDKLIKETGGVVQGMSGSPIMQNDKIIGAVTHVIVDNPATGYGLFITTMLEEGES